MSTFKQKQLFLEERQGQNEEVLSLAHTCNQAGDGSLRWDFVEKRSCKSPHRNDGLLTISAASNAVIATGKSFVTNFTNPMLALVIEMFNETECPANGSAPYRVWLRALNCSSRDCLKNDFASTGWPHI